MITLHRLGHAVDTFQINPDAITTITSSRRAPMVFPIRGGPLLPCT